jgi:hypothetical protein
VEWSGVEWSGVESWVNAEGSANVRVGEKVSEKREDWSECKTRCVKSVR